MKIYRTPEGIFHGRRSEAGPAAEIVEVDTSAAGISAFANKLLARYQWVDGEGDEFETVVERQDPPMDDPKVIVHVLPDLDELFLAAPIGQQLTLAAIAVEEARNCIRQTRSRVVTEVSELVPSMAQLMDERSAECADDELFS